MANINSTLRNASMPPNNNYLNHFYVYPQRAQEAPIPNVGIIYRLGSLYNPCITPVGGKNAEPKRRYPDIAASKGPDMLHSEDPLINSEVVALMSQVIIVDLLVVGLCAGLESLSLGA